MPLRGRLGLPPVRDPSLLAGDPRCDPLLLAKAIEVVDPDFAHVVYGGPSLRPRVTRFLREGRIILLRRPDRVTIYVPHSRRRWVEEVFRGLYGRPPGKPKHVYAGIDYYKYEIPLFPDCLREHGVAVDE